VTVIAARGSRLLLDSGKSLLDYHMDGGRLIAGHAPDEVAAAVADAARAGVAPAFDPEAVFGLPGRLCRSPTAAVEAAISILGAPGRPVCTVGDRWGDDSLLQSFSDEAVARAVVVEPVHPSLSVSDTGFLAELVSAARLSGAAVILDETRWWRRLDPPPDHEWDLRVLGDSAAAGLPFGAVLAKTAEMFEGHDERGSEASHVAVAAAGALGGMLGRLTTVQLAGRAERLAFGVCEVAAGAGIAVTANRAGGALRLLFDTAAEAAGIPARFAAEMADRGYLVPARGIWWPSLAHDFYEIEQTVDAAAAAMAEAARSSGASAK